MGANRTTAGRVTVAGKYDRAFPEAKNKTKCDYQMPFGWGDLPDTEKVSPKRKPKNLRVLLYLKRHGKISTGKMKFMGIKNNRSCIQSLRNRGHVIRFKNKEYHYEGINGTV
jgi:hypothetical protein